MIQFPNKPPIQPNQQELVKWGVKKILNKENKREEKNKQKKTITYKHEQLELIKITNYLMKITMK